MTDTQANEFILAVASDIKKEDFEFSVNVRGVMYDVYWFHKDGDRIGQLAFAMADGKVEIAYFRSGRRSAIEIMEYMVDAEDEED